MVVTSNTYNDSLSPRKNCNYMWFCFKVLTIKEWVHFFGPLCIYFQCGLQVGERLHFASNCKGALFGPVYMYLSKINNDNSSVLLVKEHVLTPCPLLHPQFCAWIGAIHCDSSCVTRVTREAWTERFRGFTWSSCSLHEMFHQEIGTTFVAVLEGSLPGLRGLRCIPFVSRFLQKLFYDGAATASNQMGGRKRYHITQ
jgi:hypothetical protein